MQQTLYRCLFDRTRPKRMLTGTILTVLSVFVPVEQRDEARCMRAYVHMIENKIEEERKKGWNKRMSKREKKHGDRYRRQEIDKERRGRVQEIVRRKMRKEMREHNEEER